MNRATRFCLAVIACGILPINQSTAKQPLDGAIAPLPKPKPGYEWVLLVQRDGTRVPQQIRVVDATGIAKPSSARSKPSRSEGSNDAMSSTPLESSPPPTLSEAINEKINSINLDRPLPAAAAFVALDISPETVNQPSSPRELAAALLNGVDRNGTLQTGLAIEAAPFQIFHRGNYNIEDYNDNSFSGTARRILYNSSISIATAKASSNDDKSERLSLGFHFCLYDNRDPKASKQIKQIADEAWEKFPPPIPHRDATPEENAAQDAVNEKAVGKFIDDRIAQWRKEHWAQTAWDVAWAPVWLTPTSNASDLRYDGSVAYTSFAFGFEKDPLGGENRLQLITQARFREGEHVLVPDTNAAGRQDTLLFGGRVRYGSADFNGSIEAAYVRIWNGPLGDGDRFRYGIGFERKLFENVWVTMTLGEETGGGNKREDNLFAIGGLRFGTADKPKFDPMPSK